MNWRRIGKALLFPHTAVMAVITPVAIVLLAYAFVFKEDVHAVSIVSYVFSAYVLTAWCFRAPRIIAYFKNIKNNKYARKWLSDTRLRVNVSLFGSLLWNTAYGIFHLWLGLVHSSFWFASLASYYILLALMRFFLVRYTRKNVPGEKMLTELKKYRNCGRVFLVMNLALSLMVFFMIYWNRTFEHGEIVTIAMAAYTFVSFTMAVISIKKYRKYNSPVFSAAKAISLASACVSVLTLEATMLNTFGNGKEDMLMNRIMLAASGAVISAVIIAMAVCMIVRGTKKIKLLKAEENNER
ncbi:MAG: hypothetical protein E7619_04285 [Ruminococcaceae bacterium]|nr:hypothetical protein [Oscillospiraceae bacterium]